jgi:hypothetical protein
VTRAKIAHSTLKVFLKKSRLPPPRFAGSAKSASVFTKPSVLSVSSVYKKEPPDIKKTLIPPYKKRNFHPSAADVITYNVNAFR